MSDVLTLLPYATFGLAAYAAVRGHYISREQARRDARLDVVEKQVALFWGMVEQHMTTVLHSPHTPVLDVLLEKYQAGVRFNPEEARALSQMLLEIINDPLEQQGNRTGAVFLLAALDVRYDLGLGPCVEGE